jgi:hypothetical protein
MEIPIATQGVISLEPVWTLPIAPGGKVGGSCAQERLSVDTWMADVGVYTKHMHDAFQHLVLLLFDLGALALGRFMVRHPERIFHFFTFGIQPEQKFGVGFFRVAGWVFTVVSIIGVFMYLGLITYVLLK